MACASERQAATDQARYVRIKISRVNGDGLRLVGAGVHNRLA